MSQTAFAMRRRAEQAKKLAEKNVGVKPEDVTPVKESVKGSEEKKSDKPAENKAGQKKSVK